MPIAIHEQDGGITRVVLSGRIDIAGAAEIDLPLSLIGGTRRAVIIDLAAVEFIASMGLRSLVIAGKTVLQKRGRVVLLAPVPAVAEVIVTSGVDELLPIYALEAEAIAAVQPD